MNYGNIKVKNLMVPKEKLVVLPPEATIKDAAESMEKNNVGSVLVVKDEKLVGIFTERNIVKAIANKGPVSKN